MQYYDKEELEYHMRRRELYEKFGPEFCKVLNYDPIASAVFESLVRGQKFYDTIEQLIKIIREQREAYTKYITAANV